MADKKRFYWLKLQHDFFQSKRIKKLRKIAGGDTYTIIYLKMQLKAIHDGGVLTFTGIENTFAEELALDIDEDPENVAVTVNYLMACGLLETGDGKEYVVPYAIENTGSETAAAQRVREHRARKALHCNTDETPMKQICNGEIEKEKEKEIDSEIEGEKELPSFPPSDGTKKKYGEHVELTLHEYSMLMEEYGIVEFSRRRKEVDLSENEGKNWVELIRGVT